MAATGPHESTLETAPPGAADSTQATPSDDRMAPGSVMIIKLLMVSTFVVLLDEMMLGVALPTLKPRAITAYAATGSGLPKRVTGHESMEAARTPPAGARGLPQRLRRPSPGAGPITSRHQYRSFCVSSIWCPPGAGNFSL